MTRGALNCISYQIVTGDGSCPIVQSALDRRRASPRPGGPIAVGADPARDSGGMTRGRDPAHPHSTAVDRTLGRVVVRSHARQSSLRFLEVDGHMYGAVDLHDPQRLELDYLARYATLLDAVLPAGPADLLHLGGGAFALPRALGVRRPELRQVVVERSAAVLRLAQSQLGLRSTRALRVIEGDARDVVERTATGSVDAVAGDAFVGRRTPRRLSTVEFVTHVARVLRRRGVYVVNLIDGPPWRVLAAHAATVRTALPHVVAVGSPAVARLCESGNVLLAASRQPLQRSTLAWRLDTGPDASALVGGGRLAALAARSHPTRDR